MSRSLETPLDGEIILITGAASGIGRALARKLATMGGIIYALDLPSDELQELSSENLRPMAIDFTNRKFLTKAVGEIYERHGHVDCLFNTAAVTVFGPAATLKPEHWHEVLDINIMGMVSVIDLIYPRMVEKGSGHIINLSSIVAETGHASAAPFGCSKAFILGLHRSMQPEAAQHGVDLTLVLPGYGPVDLFQKHRIVGANEKEVREASALCASTPEMVAEFIIRGVLKKKRIIYYPFKARIFWILAHWFPFFLSPLQKRFMKPFEKSDSKAP